MDFKGNVTNLIIIIMIFFLVVEFGSIFFVKSSIESNIIASESKTQMLLAAETATLIEVEMKNILDSLHLISQFPEIVGDSSISCNSKLDEAFEIVNINIDDVIRVNEDGLIYCATNPAIVGKYVSNTSQVRKITLDDPAHHAFLANITNRTSSGRYVAAMYIPVYDNQKFEGALGGVIYFDKIKEKYLDRIRFLEKGSVTLLDENGDILYTQDSRGIGMNMFSEEVQNFFRNRDSINSFLKDVISGEYGSNNVTTIKVNDDDVIVAFANAEVFPGRTWSVFVSSTPERTLDSFNVNSIRGFGFFTLIFVAVSIIGILGVLIIYQYMQKTEATSKERRPKRKKR